MSCFFLFFTSYDRKNFKNYMTTLYCDEDVNLETQESAEFNKSRLVPA